jgi:hypothetical protein
MDQIRFIFACFGTFAKTVYSHHWLHIRFKMFEKVLMQIFIVSYWRIFASKYSLGSEYSQNFERISRSSEYWLANIHIQVNIRLQIFATYGFKLYRKGFTRLRPQLIFVFWKYSLHFASKYSLCSEINKIFASKGIFGSVFIRFAC